MRRFLLVAMLLASASPCVAEDPQPSIEQWGFGLGIGVEQYRAKYIDQASIYGADRIVTIEKEFDTLPSAWLTLNWNIWPRPKPVPRAANDVDAVKLGLFTGVKILDAKAQTFSAFALGPQVSFFAGKRVITVGAGWVTHRTKTFASGIVAGSALPEQYTDIKYREGTENSYMLMFSVQL